MTQIHRAVYSATDSQKIERAEYARLGSVTPILMERAGYVIRDSLLAHFPDAAKIALFAGPGNNGGDAFIAAHLLRQVNKSVTVYAPLSGDSSPQDSQWARNLYVGAGGRCATYAEFASSADVDLIVDGLFGSGLRREITGSYADVVNKINQHHAPTFSIDIPTGISSDTGEVLGVAISAALTLALITEKSATFNPRALAYMGKRLFHSLDVSREAYANADKLADVLNEPNVINKLPVLNANAHKGQRGTVLVIGGEKTMPGAAIMAAEAALSAGAGRVILAMDASHQSFAVIRRPELMLCSVTTADDLNDVLPVANAIVIGPGLGKTTWSQSLLARVGDSMVPTVYDADALNMLSEKPCQLHAQDVMTPHPGEAQRLLNRDGKLVMQNRLSAAIKLYELYGANIVLKGAATLVGQHKQFSICPCGNKEMSVAGMGDILAGMIGAFIARGMASNDAAELGVLVHALAGDASVAQHDSGVMATDLLPEISRILNVRAC